MVAAPSVQPGDVPSLRELRAALLTPTLTPGASSRAALSGLTDGWLATLFEKAGGSALDGVGLAAVGGFGRGELSPGSDVDVVLLHDGRRSAKDVAALAERLWYPIWDSGMRLDHSVRTVAEARSVAAADLPAALGLLDLRTLAGDASLGDALRAAVLADWRAAARRRLPELLAGSRLRAETSGEVAFLLEPDLKEAKGGLRDWTCLRAIAASWVADRPHGRLDAAVTRLLDVRDALHLVTSRSGDRLLLAEQDAVAERAGAEDADDLMADVSAAARTVTYAVDVTFRRVEQALRPLARPARGLFRGRGGSPVTQRSPVGDGLVEQAGEVVLARDARPAEDPVLLLRAAAAAAQVGLPLAPDTVERLAAECPPLPEPWPQQARDELVALLGAGPACVPVWEALDQAGIITGLLPEWALVRCRPQRNAVHRWTVDRHLVEAAARAADLTRRVARPDLLLVGALMHDLGKGVPGGDHSVEGARLARVAASRMGYGAADVEVLVRLVRHHLTLVDAATRRDPEDPVTVASVAAAVVTSETLDLLAALTEADAGATGPAAWSDWRAALVSDLARRVRASLAGDLPEPVGELTAEQQALVDAGQLAVHISGEGHGWTVTVVAPDAPGLLGTVAGVLALHRLSVRTATARSDGGVAVNVWSVAPVFGEPPSAAALREDVRRALDRSLDVAAALSRREAAYAPRAGVPVPPPRVDVVDGASASATVLEVRAHDRAGLLHRLGRALTLAGTDVRAARVATLGAEAVDVFYVVDGHTGLPLDATRAREVARVLADVAG